MSKSQIEHDEFLKVVSMTAESAKAFFGREDEPVDLGPPDDPARWRDGARVWGFRMRSSSTAGGASNAPDPRPTK